MRRLVGGVVGTTVALVAAYGLAIATGSQGPWFVLLPVGLVVGALAGGSWRSRRRCPRCAEEVRAAAHVCRHCGYEFETV